MSAILVTGASGFIGRRLIEHQQGQGHRVRAAFRQAPEIVLPGVESVVVGNIHDATRWQEALSGIDTVIHLAGMAHVLKGHARDPLAAARRVNVEGTARLAHEAADAGVKRFVLVSSIKVLGELSGSRGLRPTDPLAPADPYSQSKAEAEDVLRQVAAETGLEAVIVRPPLVYGPGVKGRFYQLLRALARGWPVPVASCDNRRSFIGLENLVDFLGLAATHPAAANQVWHISDGEDLATRALLKRLAIALGVQARVWALPPSLLRAGLTFLGKTGVYERLCGSLVVDSSATRTQLGWRPVSTVASEFARTAAWFRCLPRE